MSGSLRYRGPLHLDGPDLLAWAEQEQEDEAAAAAGSGAAAAVRATGASADGLDVQSRLAQPGQEGLPPLASFSKYFNRERVRIDKVMSCVLLVSWAAAVFRFVPRCPQLETWFSLVWASVLAASLAWSHFSPSSYAGYREQLMALLRITRWAFPCIARPTVYIALRGVGGEGSGSGSCWHQGAAGPLAILLLVPVMQLQAALGYHVRLPWAAVVLAGELALTLPRQCALCTDPLMQPGQQGGAVVRALHSAFSFLLGMGTASGSGDSAGGASSSPGNQCWAVVVMLELVLGFLLPLAVTSARERAAFGRFYRYHRGWVHCDSCCAVYLASVAGDDGASIEGAAGSVDESGAPERPALSASKARRWVRWAQVAACAFALLWVQWDVIIELSALRRP